MGMSYGKKRLAVFLSMLVVLMTVLELVPAQEVQAASGVRLSWNYGDRLLVQKGDSDLYMGDYVTAYSYDSQYTYYGYLTNNSGVKYKSSDSSVIGINGKTGEMTAKKMVQQKLRLHLKEVRFPRQFR